MEKQTEFDEIRPYNDEELPQIFEKLIADPEFRRVAAIVKPEVPFEILAGIIRGCKTKVDFQKTLCYKPLWDIAKSCTDGLKLDHTSLTDKNKPYTYISNHRDIILDSGLLSVLLVDQGMKTVEIAIGDNLLIYPWIEKFVRVNKSFIVKRSLPLKQMLESSSRMSRYMHYAIARKNESIWIAQREGRAKDSNDRTQESLIKMLAMGGEGDTINRLKTLNIVPLAISYEYDPCDYLKAMEFQLKRDNPEYKKTTLDDLKNMETGLFGYKGRVNFRTAPCLNEELDKLDPNISRQELFLTVAALIDREIHRNYTLYPVNYIAHDLLFGDHIFSAEYTAQERERFEAYLSGQIAKIDLPDKDISFLHTKMLLMYANPLTNYLAAIQ